MKRYCYMTVVLIFVITANICFSANKTPRDKKFESPEIVMQAFASHIAKGDVAGALTLFDFNEAAEGLDFILMSNRLMAIMPQANGPSDYEAFAEINRIRGKSRAADQLRGMLYSLLLPDEFSVLLEGRPYAFKSKDEEKRIAQARDFVRSLDPKRLKNFKFVRLNLANPKLQNSEKGIKAKRNTMRTFGSQDTKDYFALYTLDDAYFLGGVTFSRYDGGWLITGLYSHHGETSSLGTLKKVTKESYDAMILQQSE